MRPLPELLGPTLADLPALRMGQDRPRDGYKKVTVEEAVEVAENLVGVECLTPGSEAAVVLFGALRDHDYRILKVIEAALGFRCFLKFQIEQGLEQGRPCLIETRALESVNLLRELAIEIEQRRA